MNDTQYRYELLFQHCHEVEAQRDELLAALVEIKQLFSPDGDYAITRKDNMWMGTGEVFNIGLILMRASSAIAKATGD